MGSRRASILLGHKWSRQKLLERRRAGQLLPLQVPLLRQLLWWLLWRILQLVGWLMLVLCLGLLCLVHVRLCLPLRLLCMSRGTRLLLVVMVHAIL